jgi:class 3 adenylate cyclase
LQKEKEILEAKVVERTHELQEEKKKTDELLHNILPHETAVELIESGQAKTRHYESVSVLFSDFKGFTQLSEKLEPNALVNQLDEYFKLFDSNTVKFGIEKIKTIGDAYMCAAGLPNASSNHAQDLVGFAFTMLESVEQLNSRNAEKGLPNWQLRIGIHSGPVIAGVVGDKKFAYDIWGDTVNIASRMESSGSVGQINISEATHVLISDQYECEARGKIKAKNKGSMDMFFVLNSKNQSIHESLHKERG